uniref:Acid phosphatase n=1 Tax=Panagrolaimus sp. ES5 TaxID=591445 RepID=A0AC34FW13_9BILA
MLIYFILLFFNVIISVTSEDKLIHVHALWRHGERNPRKLFYGDLNNASAFPEGLGQLTKNGINQLYVIGKHFQARYMYEKAFLSPEYLHSEVYARSTDIDRTIISAMAFYSGLYSNGTNEAHILAPRLYGLPIPEWITMEKSEEFDKLFVDYVSTQYGFMPFINDTFPYNLQLELARISSGALIAEIVDRLKLKIQCLKNVSSECIHIHNQKLFTYSGHDITVVELFSGLGFKSFTFEQKTLPSFGATIIIELWADEGITNSVANVGEIQYEYYYVKIYYYQNSTIETPKFIGNLLPECQGEEKGCPFSYLIKRAELLRPKPDLKGYCNQMVKKNNKKEIKVGYKK